MAAIARGTIKERPLAEILWCIHWMRLKGCLELEQPPHRKSLYFRDGVAFFARSTMKSEALGKFLIARKLITPDAYESATLASIQQGLKLGEALIRGGAITRAALDGALLDQVRERFLAAFSLREASWWWSPELSPEAEEQRGKIPVLPLIRDGIGRHLGFDAISTALMPWMQDAIVRTRSFSLVTATVELSPEEQRVLALVDGSRRLGELISVSQLDPQVLLPALFLARCIGLVRGSRDPEPRTLLDPAPEAPAAIPPATAPLAPPPPPPPPEPARDGMSLDEQRWVPPPKPGAKGDARKTGAVPRSFGFVRHDEDVEVDPAAVAPPAGATPRPASITKSFGFVRPLDEEVVMDVSGVAQPARREIPPVARHAAPSGSGGVQRVLDANRSFKRGEAAFGRGELTAAIEEYERALEIDALEPEYLAGLALAIYFQQTALAPAPDAAQLERALDAASRALQTRPGWSRGLYAKGLCAKALRLPEHAALMEEALLLDPSLQGHEARTRSRLRGGDEGGTPGGILDRASKLFRR